jgi:hypothetical protein
MKTTQPFTKRDNFFCQENIELVYSNIYSLYREEWEKNLPEHLQYQIPFALYRADATVLKRSKLWNTFLRSKNCGIYFSYKNTKPLIYCKKKFLLSFIKYGNV